MLALGFAKTGEKALISRVTGTSEMKKHLEDLGLCVGTEVQVISAPGKGNLIIRVKDSRLAITDQMANHIMVG